MGKWYYGVFVGAGIFVGFLANDISRRYIKRFLGVEGFCWGFW
jgi:hypothetical protein